MLVLSRRETQRIKLGDEITITIVKLSGDKVRIGIDAPADVVILREELTAAAAPAAVAEAGPPESAEPSDLREQVLPVPALTEPSQMAAAS